MSKRHDMVVIGAGPAGTALVSALCDAGFDVAWCSSQINSDWVNKYGLWVDELPESLSGADVFEATWSEALIAIPAGRRIVDRAYGRVDSAALKRVLLEGRSRTDYAADVHNVRGSAGSFVVECGPETLEADLVFDATGVGHFLEDDRPSHVAAQTAYGVLARVEGDPTGGVPMALMDFDDSFRDDDGPATFLYAMQLDEDVWFLEETVLVERPPYPIGDLKDLLYRRMESRDARILEVFEEERCFIPMGTPLPSFDQSVVGFGAAAGFVHPASGYSLARSLKDAPVVAAASSSGRPEEIWRSMWSDDRVRSRHLFEFGMESLLTMSRDGLHEFFEAFFELPDTSWRPYLHGDMAPGEVQRVMLRLFAGAPMSVRLRLAKAAVGPNTAKLLRGMFG